MPRFIFLLGLLSLPLHGQTAADFSEPIQDITLNVNLLQNSPQFLAADTIGIIVEARMESFYKLRIGDDIIGCGRLSNGKNPLLLRQPGMFAKTQTLPFVLELKTGTLHWQKMIFITVTIANNTERSAEPRQVPAGEFTIKLLMAGRQIGFRKKTMTDLLTLTTGPVTQVDDPALSGSAIRSAPSGQSLSIFGMAMGIAKYLAGKKLAAAKNQAQANAQKRKITVRFAGHDQNNGEMTVGAEIELRTD